MTKKLKVYTMTVMGRREWREVLKSPLHHRQVHVMVAAPSRAAALRAYEAVGVRVTAGDFTYFGGEGSNDHDEAIALAQPGRVFYAPLDVAGIGEWHLAEVVTL